MRARLPPLRAVINTTSHRRAAKRKWPLVATESVPSRGNLGFQACLRGVLAAEWRRCESRVAKEQVGSDAETVTRLVSWRLSTRNMPALTASSWPRWPAHPSPSRGTIFWSCLHSQDMMNFIHVRMSGFIDTEKSLDCKYS